MLISYAFTLNSKPDSLVSFFEYVRLMRQRLFILLPSGHHLTGRDRLQDLGWAQYFDQSGQMYSFFFLIRPSHSQHDFKLWKINLTGTKTLFWIHPGICVATETQLKRSPGLEKYWLSTLTLSEIRMRINPEWRILPVCLYRCSEPSILLWWPCWTGVLSVSLTAPPSLVECKHWGGGGQTSGDQ